MLYFFMDLQNLDTVQPNTYRSFSSYVKVEFHRVHLVPAIGFFFFFCGSTFSSYNLLLIYYDCLFRSIRFHGHLRQVYINSITHDTIQLSVQLCMYRYQFRRLINTIPLKKREQKNQ